MPLTIGLTGGIASGKSLVTQTFEELGVPVLDADRVSREVVAPPSPQLDAIAREFGTQFLQADGTLDRRQLRQRVFGDEAARRRLEQIMHPAIRERLLRWRDAQTAAYCILAVAILLESGMDSLVHRILVVDASAARQIERLRQRDRIDEALARQMLAAQATRQQRLARADDVIENDGDLESLRRAVHALHLRYCGWAREGKPTSFA